ncbi:TcfC E-set like domain-containing protein [Sphingomonas sp. BN140010]|uniref:TcfC E-set like domain-containing protein n=1 Tax=Sphingomonas arvum TaxID=2992113 RepID=A0ABT3JF73_9SPHN|nr:TcfC E-set like domain-containing protein [Sphingomonas sp. BN140010]MCW3797709.1 TcfC E-set like domain-containing protein [Sphingomonas sp. BN140010]
MTPRRRPGFRTLLLGGSALVALPTPALAATTATTATNASSSNSTSFEVRITAPADFAALDGPHELVMDLHLGGQRLGEVNVVSDHGTIRFRDPAAAAALVPNLADPAALIAALARPLDANAELVCGKLNSTACGAINTDTAAIIADEGQLRIDLFVGARLLKAVAIGASGFLPAPTSGPSLASALGLTMSGRTDERPLYHLQSRNVLGWGAGRVRSNVALASGFGLLVDDLVAEFDRPDQRFSGGLFWAPGNDFTGERRVLGLGFETQLDTRADRERLQGTPLTLFLRQPARVEMLVDGRLVDARYYEAGNTLLDTSVLPSGSYNLVLRIQEGGGPVREERRFFVRSAEMAPLGRPLFHLVAGLLADSRKGRPISLDRRFYYAAGANVRLAQALGVEGSVTGTQAKALGQAGLFLVTRFARLRAAALRSTDGDSGALLQLGSAEAGQLQFTFDLRRVNSRSGQPLLPETASGESFGGALVRSKPLVGSYTQLTGNLGMQLGRLDLQVSGYFRGGNGPARDFSVGPNVAWRLVQLPGLQFTVLADAQKTGGGLSGFVGARLLMMRGGLSTISSGGTSLGRRGSSAQRRSIGNTGVQWDTQPWEDSRLSLGAGLNRESSGTSVTGSAMLQSRLGTARADLSRRLGGKTGYALSLQSGGAVTGGALSLGGKELAESALVATVRGRAGAFELLVDGVPRGRLRSGGSLPLYLSPYRTYQIQLRPLDSGAIDFDPAPRKVTLYPGNVEHAVWDAQKLLTLFGRLVDASGQPLGNARLDGGTSEDVSGADGWFQFDRQAPRTLAFTRPDGRRCSVPLPAGGADKDYLSLGTVTCS